MASIRKRTWTSGGETKTAWVADYVDQAAKRHLKTFRTKREADGWLVSARSQIAQGVHTPESASISVAEAAELWLRRGELEGLERNTLREYRRHAEQHIIPVIGVAKLARLTTPAIENFRDTLLGKSSRITTGKVITSLKSILGEAQRRGLIAYNPASPVRVDLRARAVGKLVVGRDVPSKPEIQTALAAAENSRWRSLLVVAVFTGLRASELRALTWASVDFDRKTLRVHQRADRWGSIGQPKSAAGDREIPMAPMVVNTLREWRLTCPKGPADLVFPSGAGSVESHSNMANRGWYELQRRAGITDATGKPKYGLHALRHFFASWAIEQGFSPKRVQVLLGHSSIQMTFDRYGHLFPSLEDDHAKFAAGEAALTAWPRQPQG